MLKLLIPVKLNVLFAAEMAPPCVALLLSKLLAPLKLTRALSEVWIAPPEYAELLMKLLVPLKLTVFDAALIAPP